MTLFDNAESLKNNVNAKAFFEYEKQYEKNPHDLMKVIDFLIGRGWSISVPDSDLLGGGK